MKARRDNEERRKGPVATLVPSAGMSRATVRQLPGREPPNFSGCKTLHKAQSRARSAQPPDRGRLRRSGAAARHRSCRGQRQRHIGRGKSANVVPTLRRYSTTWHPMLRG
jgi:hypothetical protein